MNEHHRARTGTDILGWIGDTRAYVPRPTDGHDKQEGFWFDVERQYKGTRKDPIVAVSCKVFGLWISAEGKSQFAHFWQKTTPNTAVS